MSEVTSFTVASCKDTSGQHWFNRADSSRILRFDWWSSSEQDLEVWLISSPWTVCCWGERWGFWQSQREGLWYCQAEGCWQKWLTIYVFFLQVLHLSFHQKDCSCASFHHIDAVISRMKPEQGKSCSTAALSKQKWNSLVSCSQHSYFGPCPFEEVRAGGGSLIACARFGV